MKIKFLILIVLALFVAGCAGSTTVKAPNWTKSDLERVTALDIIGPAGDVTPDVTSAIRNVLVHFLSGNGYQAPQHGAPDIISIKYALSEILSGTSGGDWQHNSYFFKLTLTYSNKTHGMLFSNKYSYFAESPSAAAGLKKFLGVLPSLLENKHPLRLYDDTKRY